MPLIHWLQLALTSGIGPITAQRMIALAGSAEAATQMNVAALRQVEGLGAARAQGIGQSLREAAEAVEDELARADDAGAQLICPDDETYPPLLKTIPDPPLVLYVKGSLEARDLNAVAIVGSRKCSHYGREQAERFAALLAGAGVTVISGGARGVDSAAHRGALSHPLGRTIAVLGCGVEELVTRFGAENAIKRVETELRRAKRARSRKLHAFWSDVFVRIETQKHEPRKSEARTKGVARGHAR